MKYKILHMFPTEAFIIRPEGHKGSGCTLKVRASSRNLRFSVGTKPLRKMLMPSLTLKGMVTTP